MTFLNEKLISVLLFAVGIVDFIGNVLSLAQQIGVILRRFLLFFLLFKQGCFNFLAANI